MAKLTKSALNILALELVALRATKKELLARETVLTDIFKSLGGFDGTDVLVSVSHATRNGVDLDRLRSLYADVAKDCNKQSLVTTVSVKRKK